MDAEMVSYLVGILGLGGIIFGIYNHFKDPQTRLERDQAVADKSMEGKAAILAQQLQWEKEANERRFAEMQGSIKDAMTLAQNHLHTTEEKINTLTNFVNSMNLNLTTKIAELSTKIGRRSDDGD